MSLSVKVSVRSRILFPGDDLECTISVAPPVVANSHNANNDSLRRATADTDDDASASAEKSPFFSDSNEQSSTTTTTTSTTMTSEQNNNGGTWNWISSWFASNQSISSTSPSSLPLDSSSPDSSTAVVRKAPLLDYVTVQVVGKYMADSSWIRLTPPYAAQTAGADGARLLCESAPCTVAEGVESCLVRYTFPLPRKMPPTFKGMAIKYYYYIRVAAKQRGAASAEHIVTIPFRVINPLGNIAVIHVAPKPVVGVEAKLHDLQPLEQPNNRQAVQLTDTIAHAASAVELLGSPLVRARQRAPTVSASQLGKSTLTSPQLRVASLSNYYRRLQREQQSQNVQNGVKTLFAKLSRPLSIEISRARRHVAQFTINRTAFQLGDVIVGQFDFSRATTACYQVSCSLDYDEAVAVEMQPAASAAVTSAAALSQQSQALNDSGAATHIFPPDASELTPHASVEPAPVPARYAGSATLRKTVAEAHTIAVHTLHTGMSLAIPPQAPHSFSTSHVRVSWTLRFEFAIAARSRADSNDVASGNALVQPAVDCLHWELPIQVLVPEKPAEYLFERDSERILL